MASSSSSSPRPYEVFLNFRGEDTRNNFVSHLHSALQVRGIRTYFDESNLQKGQTIGPELMKAIEESSIAIVVLSTNYGSSTWCLNELVKIMECQNKPGLVVFPIFYHVDPSDVRWQQNSFFEAFSNHEVNFKDDVLKVKSWRKALHEVADLAGVHIIREKNEASCIKEIADKILMQLPVKASEFRKSIVGIESRILEIKKMMHSKPNEVLFIGLWGMGGIGKTTTARAIYEDCKNDFEGHCLLLDVRQSKNRMKDLQEKLLSNVLNTKFDDICDVVEGSSMIKDRLQFKKVLIIIDDVDDIDQLNALGKQCDWFGGGSRIIITTRNQHLIDDVHIQKYDVQLLPQNESLHLFCLHAFKNGHPLEDFRELSLQVLRYAGGLPLALQVLGEHLYRQEKYYWEGTLSTLKNIPKHKIISKLQISFDGLNVLHQDIFLDIACLFKGGLKIEVEKRLECLGLHPKEGIVVLVQKSLISIVDGCIRMHDLLQDMGRYIVIERSNRDVRRYSRLWLLKDIAEVLVDVTVSSDAERIRMRTNYYGDCDGDGDDDDVICLELGWDGAFKNMNKLSFLELRGDVFKGNYNDVNVSQSFGQLYKELRWFSWNGYPGLSLPKSFHPRNLVHLHMQYSKIEETPDFSHMPNLEVLNLSSSIRLVRVHKSLGNHMKIKHINLECCENLVEFPEMNHMKSLEILNLSFTSLQSFPEIHGNLDSLRELKLRRTLINGLPTSILGNASSLQKLRLECHSPFDEEFTSLEVVAEVFLELVHLEITGSGIMKTLDFSRLPYLEKLDLSSSKELVEVHASLGVHKRIKYINLQHCSKLEEFPRIGHMKSLEVLNLFHTSLQSFPDIYGKLDSLRYLKFSGRSINGLPTSIVGKATGLQKLELECYGPFNEEFTSLEVVADSFPGLVCLEITGSSIVKTLDFSRLPYLEKLDLSFSEELVEVHASLGVHKRIKNIVLAYCSKLVEFPIIGDMNSLEVLNLSGTSLQSFPEIAGNGNCLTRLNLDRTKITTLPWSIGQATNLKFISMQNCENLLTLPVSILGLQIETVSISSGAFKYFKGSIELHSQQRKRRKQLIGSQGMGQLSCAEIKLSYCKSLEVLPEVVLSRVNTLSITECPTLTSWVCFKLVDLLDNYQHLCRLQLHQREDIAAFLELVPNFSTFFRKWVRLAEAFDYSTIVESE